MGERDECQSEKDLLAIDWFRCFADIFCIEWNDSYTLYIRFR